MGAIELITAIPGPKSQAMMARREAAVPNGAAKLTPLGIATAKGSVVVDVDGNHLIDLAGGIGVLGVGHCPEGVVSALQAQAADLIHICNIVATAEPYLEVAERLNALTPGDFDKRTLLCNTGAEAVEAAVGIARSATGRQGVVVFEGAYHGRSNLTLAMTSKFGLFKKGFGPFAPEIYRLPFPDLYRRPAGLSETEAVDQAVRLLDRAMVAHVDPSHVAAVVIEPVLGEGGFLPAPPPFLQRLRELCDQHGMLLVADEVQAGFGRTGKLFSIEHAGVVPDLVTTAKSLAAGMPLAAVTGRAEVMDAPHPGGLGGTYSGNPLACVAAVEAIDTIREPAFLARAQAAGDRIRGHLEAIQAEHPDVVGDVRGLGAMLVMELVTDAESKTPDPDATVAVNAATLERGVITIRAGLYSNCVRFLPALTISDEEIDEAMAVVTEAVRVAAKERASG
jgi:4-aminobutyrate aminotransferase / (S)-3-amino-2-methylpropionate transaminase / 5-aminovalerate transaminase